MATGRTLLHGAGACLAAVIATAALPEDGARPWLLAFSAALVVLGVLGALRPDRVPVRTVLFCAVVFVLFTAGRLWSWPPALTTVAVCTVPLAALLLLSPGPVARTAPWLRWGVRPDRTVLVLSAVTVLVAAVSLILWALVFRPDAGPYLSQVAGLPLWLALLGVVAFALVNPIWEETLFRGVLLEDLREAWGPGAAVAGQSVVFGVAHWAGFPSGVIGMVMAALWGAALGVIRLRSGGIGLPYLVHVGANATIGVLAVLLLT